MTSDFIDQCLDRAFASIRTVLDSGKRPTHIEISADLMTLISMGGFNMMGQPIFAGLPILERVDLTNHIEAVVRP